MEAVDDDDDEDEADADTKTEDDDDEEEAAATATAADKVTTTKTDKRNTHTHAQGSKRNERKQRHAKCKHIKKPSSNTLTHGNEIVAVILNHIQASSSKGLSRQKTLAYLFVRNHFMKIIKLLRRHAPWQRQSVVPIVQTTQKTTNNNNNNKNRNRHKQQ
jgi:hypothetical protein